jgi:hypothetical protein
MSDSTTPSREAHDVLTMTFFCFLPFFETTGLLDSSFDESLRSKSLKSDSSEGLGDDFLCMAGLFNTESEWSNSSELVG